MKFRSWLAQSHYTAATLAEVLGVSRQAVYYWLDGHNLPSTKHLLLLHRLSDGKIDLNSFSAHAASAASSKKASPSREG